MMQYKGYIGQVEYDDEGEIFHGEVLNLRDVITFQGKTTDELKKAFIESIEDYLEWCKKDGITPERPYSGKFVVRIDPELHQKAAIEAAICHKSINKMVEEALAEKLSFRLPKKTQKRKKQTLLKK